LAFALAASHPIMSGVRDFGIAAVPVISRDGFSPFYLGVRRACAGNTGSKTLFAGDFFARHRIAAASRSRGNASGPAAAQSANRGDVNS
jgi:hypothetical protein